MKVSRSTAFLVKLGLSVLGYGLLIYAASRTLEFVSATIPAEKQWMGFLYLLATGVGALIWLHVYLHDAKGAKRRGISMGIAIVDLLMEFALVYADTMRESSKQGLLTMSQDDLRLFILASVVAVGLNAFAWFFYTLSDPDKEQERKAADFVDEIEEEAMKLLSTPEARQNMIAEHAPHIQDVIMQRVSDHVAARFTGKPILADPRMPIIPADPRQYEQAVPQPTQTIKPHPLEQYNYLRPPYGDRNHPDLTQARIPMDIWETIIREWAIQGGMNPDDYPAYLDQELRKLDKEAAQTPSPFRKSQSE